MKRGGGFASAASCEPPPFSNIYNKKKGMLRKGGAPPHTTRRGGKFYPIFPPHISVAAVGRSSLPPKGGSEERGFPPPLSCVARALHGWRTLRGRVSSAKLGER